MNGMDLSEISRTANQNTTTSGSVNLWGFACVKLTLGRKVIRVGTDDAEGLAKFLGEKTGLSGLSE